jgi:hypothetical protein
VADWPSASGPTQWWPAREQHGWNEKPQTRERSAPCRFRRIGGANVTIASVGNSLLFGSSFRDELAETGFCLTIGLNSLSAFAQGLSAERACRQNPTMITVPPTPEEGVPALWPARSQAGRDDRFRGGLPHQPRAVHRSAAVGTT